ncbi:MULTISPECIES: recombinase family protein [unclassified Streptomyces]|uniref:recombinase family protein n=1 Tax=unclassified Streptomyces TaxID=2593676 RepID=UPI0036EF422B
MSATPSLADQSTGFLDAILSPHWPAVAASPLNDSWWGVTEWPRTPANYHGRLFRLCRSTLDAAVAHPGTPSKGVLYANTTMEDPARSLTAAEAYAHNRGWQVVDRFVDVATDAQPWARDGWLQVLSRLLGGFAPAVVTDDRSALSAADEPYEQSLHWLSDRFSFGAHARSGTVAPVVAPMTFPSPPKGTDHMPPTAFAEEPLALRTPGQGWSRPSWTHRREDLERIAELLRAGLPIDEAFDNVATDVGDESIPVAEQIPLLIERFRGTADSPGHLMVLIEAVEREEAGEDPHERERLIFRASQVRAQPAGKADATSLGYLRRLASAAEDLLELLLPDDEEEATPCLS